MTSLQDKLTANRNRRRREALISSIDGQFKKLILTAEYSHDPNSIKYAAFATWDSERDDWTTTRGIVNSWHKYDYAAWDALLGSLQKISILFSESDFGWLFFDTDGPYYKVAFKDLKSYLEEISALVVLTEKFEFGWVGTDKDIGIIVEFEDTNFCKNDYCMCIWQA